MTNQGEKDVRIERVFELTAPDGKYQNIKIAVEGENKVDLFREIYSTLYMDRVISSLIAGNDISVYTGILEKVKGAADIVEVMEEFGLNNTVVNAVTNLTEESIEGEI